MFSLDQPITALAPLAGGSGGFPPISITKPFAPASGVPNAPRPAAKNNQAPVISTSYPKPRLWVEKRIALCTSHHARWLKWRSANIAKLAAWVQAQPGYDETTALRMAYDAKIRNAYRAKNGRA